MLVPANRFLLPDRVTGPNFCQPDFAPLKSPDPLCVNLPSGRLWLARVENQLLWVSRSDDGGRQFSRPVAIPSVPEDIAADAENRPKMAVARDGTVLPSRTQSLPQKYSSNIRFARPTDVALRHPRLVLVVASAPAGLGGALLEPLP